MVCCSYFVVCRSSLPFCCLLFVDGCLLFVSEVVGCCLLVVCRSLLVVRGLLCGVCCAVFVVS